MWDTCEPSGGMQTQSKAPEDAEAFLHEEVTEGGTDTTTAPTAGDGESVPTQAECRCKALWGLTNSQGVMLMFEGDNVCSNPDNDPGGDWCFTAPESWCVAPRFAAAPTLAYRTRCLCCRAAAAEQLTSLTPRSC